MQQGVILSRAPGETPGEPLGIKKKKTDGRGSKQGCVPLSRAFAALGSYFRRRIGTTFPGASAMRRNRVSSAPRFSSR